jgi:PHD/YefM family antitoxin component YafN of YafNO toxin-antitoxin module
MLKIRKNIVLDERQKPVAVQIPIEEFERLEEIMEDYGLAKLMDEVKDDERLSGEDAKKYYQSLK